MPFAPDVAIDLSTRAPKARPAITATVTQAEGESAIKTLGVSFPKAFGYNERFRPPRCLPADEAARSCPAASRIGSVSAVSSVGSASGGVFITDDFRLVAFADALGGLVQIKADGVIDVTESGGFRVSFSGLPDLSLTEVELALDGEDLGLLKSPPTCGTYRLPARFESHDGETSTAEPAVEITGCNPAIRGLRVGRHVAGRPIHVSWRTTPGTTATRFALQRRRGQRFRTLRAERLPETETSLAPLRAGTYRVKLTALPGGRSGTQAFVVR